MIFEALLIETLKDDSVILKKIANANRVKNAVQLNINILRKEENKQINCFSWIY